jgi:hypothetical protein
MRGAIARGMRAAVRFKHIDPKCVRCGKNEDDFHLFLTANSLMLSSLLPPLGLELKGFNSYKPPTYRTSSTMS